MQVVVLTDEPLKEELLAQGASDALLLHWVNSPSEFIHYKQADAWIDLLFDFSPERIEVLKTIAGKPVFINAVTGSLENLPQNFIRVNGWPGFLKRTLIEMAGPEIERSRAEQIFSCFNKKIGWVADVPGFVSARVISMIINEAYFTLAEGVSTKEETDTAMKLGTNYPYGPFEWAGKIGLTNILALLKELSSKQQRYNPAALLEKEANS
ncbi:MAG TPA: 3-hydroxyacyl-CoA dehydrogenase family protein [Chitinophagaceae bacterium]